MLTKEQLNILSIFYDNPNIKATFRQIKEHSRQKSNNIVQIAIKRFLELHLIKKHLVGDVTTYSVNSSNSLSLSLLNVINEEKVSNSKLPRKILDEIFAKILKKTEFFILLVFGSHAKGKANAKSDLDIAVIVESSEQRKEIMPVLETIKRRETIAIDYHVFTRDEYLQMLDTDMENLGKQIHKNKLIHYGYIQYLHLTKGIKDDQR